MSQIQISLLSHRKALNGLLRIACLKNKFPKNIRQVALISFAICGHWEIHFSFFFKNWLSGSNSFIDLLGQFLVDSYLISK